MSDFQLFEAKRLADRSYQIKVEREPGKLSSNVPRFTAYVEEIPYCVAQGFTEEDARQEIRSVLVDYILSLLERNLPVPEPDTRLDNFEKEYVTNWLGHDFFVHAQKSVWAQLTSPRLSLQTIVYHHESEGQTHIAQFA